jgi:hypothetical protein
MAILFELPLDIRECHPDAGAILSRHGFSSRPGTKGTGQVTQWYAIGSPGRNICFG